MMVNGKYPIKTYEICLLFEHDVLYFKVDNIK